MDKKRLFKIEIIKRGHYIRITDLYWGDVEIIEKNYNVDTFLQLEKIFNRLGIEIDGIFNTVKENEKFISSKNFGTRLILIKGVNYD